MKNSIDCEVNVKLTVSEETAKQCVDILNLYLKDCGKRPETVLVHENITEKKDYYMIFI